MVQLLLQALAALNPSSLVLGPYKEQFPQPQSTTRSTSSTKEEPSVHWKTYFRLLLRSGTQHSPLPQLPLHSSRGTLTVVWHEAYPCCLR